MEESSCLYRAGQILILCIWIEKRLVDLIILKDHPRLVKKVNDSNKIPFTMVECRWKYWKKSFNPIFNEFVEKFETKKSWKDNIEGIMYWRDIISHGHTSLYRDYLLYRPDTSRKGKRCCNLRKVLVPKIPVEKKSRKFTLLLRLADDSLFNSCIRIIEEIDSVYLKYEADKLGLNYEKIR